MCQEIKGKKEMERKNKKRIWERMIILLLNVSTKCMKERNPPLHHKSCSNQRLSILYVHLGHLQTVGNQTTTGRTSPARLRCDNLSPRIPFSPRLQNKLRWHCTGTAGYRHDITVLTIESNEKVDRTWRFQTPKLLCGQRCTEVKMEIISADCTGIHVHV